MKRFIIIAVIVLMFGWAVYDYIDRSRDAAADENVLDNEVEIDESIEVGLEKGMRAPNFTLTSTDGEEVSLSDFLGKKVLLNFWATWCPPCRAEMPDMQRFYEDQEDVVVLGVNLTETRNEAEDVYPFIEAFEITFPILLDEKSRVSFLYNIQPLPTSFLINRDGTIHNIAYGALNYGLMVSEFEKMD